LKLNKYLDNIVPIYTHNTTMSSQINFTRPVVGCRHFRSDVKQIRSENNTLISGLKDILDNIEGIAKASLFPNIEAQINLIFNSLDNTLYKINISDNIPHGFKQILYSGIDNPLNMGHIRDGQNDDNESSEFGTGLKKALIYIAEKSEIITRSIDDENKENYISVEFDIPDMINKQDPKDSYEPTNFVSITPENYISIHPYEYGSTIRLQNLNIGDFSYNAETGFQYTTEQFINYLKDELSHAYSDTIRQGIFTIILNNEEIPVEDDLVELVPDSHVIQFEFYVKLNSKNDVEGVARKGETGDGKKQHKIIDYTGKEPKFKQINISEFDNFKRNPNVYKILFASLTTKNTDYINIQHQDYTYVSRGGRSYGKYKVTKQELDGYSNHIYNKINYNSKRLNRSLGLGPNKTLTKPTNMLLSAIHITQKELTKNWRKYAKQGGVLPDVSDDTDDTNSTISAPKRKPRVKPSPPVNPIPTPTPTLIPVVEIPTPVVEIPTPVVEIPTPVVEISTPVVEIPTPVVEIPTPLVEIPTPLVEIPTPIELPDESILINESKEKLNQAAKKIMEFIANTDFNRLDGYKVFNFVEMYINNN
jgi:hypothetical protein